RAAGSRRQPPARRQRRLRPRPQRRPRRPGRDRARQPARALPQRRPRRGGRRGVPRPRDPLPPARDPPRRAARRRPRDLQPVAPPVPMTSAIDTGFADFQNQALAHGPASDGNKVASHEEAAHEKRNWVRLSYDCNNHCTFCLDSNAHDGTMRNNLDIKVQIIEGREKGAERLILSGGEPTMHPNFLDFVKLGKRAGYPKVQTVTNGRMFQYPAFLTRAAENGLD